MLLHSAKLGYFVLTFHNRIAFNVIPQASRSLTIWDVPLRRWRAVGRNRRANLQSFLPTLTKPERAAPCSRRRPEIQSQQPRRPWWLPLGLQVTNAWQRLAPKVWDRLAVFSVLQRRRNRNTNIQDWRRLVMVSMVVLNKAVLNDKLNKSALNIFELE